MADSFDTITTPRLYRPTAMSSQEAVEHISDRAGIWYDVKIVDALRGLYSFPALEPAEAALVLPTRPSGLLQLLLAYPKFRIFLAGSAISALGDPLTTVATLISVYAVTRDSRLVAATYVIQALATILMTGVIGGLADRLKRRSQIALAEFGRAFVLVLTPMLIATSLYCILPVLFLLAALNAVAQPSRQAAVADLVAPSDVGRATAALVGSGMTAAAVGFPVAGLVLWVFHNISSLFVIDAVTFGLAGLLILDVGQLGGGIERVGLTSALRRTWSVRPARPHLVLMAFAVFCLSMSYPALIALAYSLASSNGAQAYTFLEATVAVGIVVGSLLVGSLKAIGTMRTASVGLIITGVMSLGVALSPNLWIAALVLLIASVANPIFAIGNQTALLQLTQPSNRGAIMTSRFGLGQTALIVGAAVGGFLTAYFKAQGTYAFLAIGLLLLGTVAFMRDRRSTLSSAHASVDGVSDIVADPLHVATKSATS